MRQPYSGTRRTRRSSSESNAKEGQSRYQNVHAGGHLGELLNDFAREVNIMRTLKHPHIAEIIGLSVMPPNIAVVLPLYDGGSLRHFIRYQQGLKHLDESDTDCVAVGIDVADKREMSVSRSIPSCREVLADPRKSQSRPQLEFAERFVVARIAAIKRQSVSVDTRASTAVVAARWTRTCERCLGFVVSTLQRIFAAR